MKNQISRRMLFLRIFWNVGMQKKISLLRYGSASINPLLSGRLCLRRPLHKTSLPLDSGHSRLFPQRYNCFREVLVNVCENGFLFCRKLKMNCKHFLFKTRNPETSNDNLANWKKIYDNCICICFRTYRMFCNKRFFLAAGLVVP